MIIKNWLTGVFIVLWTSYGIGYLISPIIWFAVFFAVVWIWLVLTISGWKLASEKRGDSWDGVISWAKGLIKL